MEADAAGMKQAGVNLLTNAANYTADERSDLLPVERVGLQTPPFAVDPGDCEGEWC